MKQHYFLALMLTLFFAFSCKSIDIAGTNPGGNDNNSALPLHTYDTAKNTIFKSNENAASSVNTQKSAPNQQANAVCPDPNKPCHHKDKKFDDWELSFKMPARLQPNKTYKSASFYAVILKIYEDVEDCDGGEYIKAAERDRKSEQANQPGRKVFASYECPNMGAVDYDFEGRMDAKKEKVVIDNFIAVYAGETKEKGEELLKSLQAKYPKAMLKQMTANFEVTDQ